MDSDVCRLCLKEAKLRNSHILPEFLYLDIYDENHRSLLISRGNEQVIQKGLREYLLCQACETKLSKYERYAKRIISEIPGGSLDATRKFIYTKDVDYRKFKLFQISMLWRASVSNHLVFKQVNLSVRHKNLLRKMLDEENPGRPSDFGCIMMTVLKPELLHKVIASPVRKKFMNRTIYKFTTGNLYWVFFASKYIPSEQIRSFFLNESGLLKVTLPSWDENDLIINIAQNLDKFKN